MSRKILPFLILLLFAGCSKESSLYPETILKETLSSAMRPEEIVYTKKYHLVGNLVASMEYWFYTWESSIKIFFQYDNSGRIIREVRDGKIIKSVHWETDYAKVLDEKGNLYAEVYFEKQRIVKFKRYDGGFDGEVIITYNHDGNLSKIGDVERTTREYLEYDLSIQNPYYLLNSIAVLRLDLSCFSKNINYKKWACEEVGDDYTIPDRIIELEYTFHPDGQVKTIWTSQSGIYLTHFEYKL